MKTKKKYKASGGAAFVTMAQGGQDLWQANADSTLNRYGYKTQPAKYKYNMVGTGKNKAGGVSGEYTDLQKAIQAPEQKVKSKDFKLLNTLDTVVSIGSALVSGSAGSIKDQLNKPKPDDKSTPSDSLMGNNLNTDPSLGNVGEQMGSDKSLNMAGVSPIQPKSTFTPSAITPPQKVENIFPVSKDTSSLFGDTMKDTKPTLHGEEDFSLMGTAELKGGGKNPKSATPVEAEGGEVEVTWDDNYNIVNTKPIVGPSHAGGGVDLKLPKNHAILNKEQQGRLSKGESLKSILDSLPNVNEAGKAQMGTENDDPNKPFWTFGQPNILSPSFYTKDTTQPLVIPAPPDKDTTKPQYLPPPTSDVSDESLMSGLQVKTPKSATFEGEPVSAKQTQKESDWGQSLMDMGFPQGYEPGKITMNKNINPSLAALPQADYTGVISNTPKGPGDGNKFKFGYPEKKAISDVAQNLVSLFQPRAQGVKVNPVSVGSPTLTTPRYQNPKASLDEVGRQVQSGITALTRSGRTDMIPSLISSSIEATNKIGEQYAQINSAAESASQAENARSSNQFSLAQASLDSDTVKENARMELEKLKMQGLQDTARFQALQAILAEPAAYDKMKSDQKIRDAAYDQMMADMQWRRTMARIPTSTPQPK